MPPCAQLADVWETDRINVLFVCTANQCRSPMAEELLRERFVARGIDDAHVGSAGMLEGGMPVSDNARIVVPGCDGYVSQRLDTHLIDAADVVIAMARGHLREVAVRSPDALAKTFTLRELVRRAEQAGTRRHDEPLDEWLARLAADRRPSDELGDDPDDDIDDPIGGPLEEYRRIAREIDDLLERFVDLAWPR